MSMVVGFLNDRQITCDLLKSSLELMVDLVLYLLLIQVDEQGVGITHWCSTSTSILTVGNHRQWSLKGFRFGRARHVWEMGIAVTG